MTYKPSTDRPFITQCVECKGEVKLVKDSSEGKGIYCFEHSHLVLKRLTGGK